MTESTKVILESKALIVQSDFQDTLYAIHKDRRGMSLFVGDKEIPILAENIIPLALEMMDVWGIWGMS